LDGVRVGVPHGEFVMDVANCRRCLCNDGSLEECEPAQDCLRIQLNPASCEYEGETITQGGEFDVRIMYELMLWLQYHLDS
jgi:hypothetical protein